MNNDNYYEDIEEYNDDNETITLKEILLDLFIEGGELEKIKLFYVSHNLERLNLIPYLELACSEGKLELAQWIQQVMPKKLSDCDISLGWDIEDNYSNFDNNSFVNYSTAFYRACFNGHLHIAQWLLTIEPLLLCSSNYINYAKMTKENGHFTLSGWIINTQKKNL